MEWTDRSQAVYEEQAFKGETCAQCEVSFKTFTDCTFTRCTFSETAFRECKFRNCAFTDCDLSLITVKGCAFSRAKFKGCKLVGVNWTDADWNDSGLFRPSLDFDHCTLNYATFFGLDLKKAALTHCIAHDVDFGEANLSGANCAYTDFSESRFWKTDLTAADFTHATNYTIAVNTNTVKQAKFSLPEAMSLLYGLGIILVE